MSKLVLLCELEEVTTVVILKSCKLTCFIIWRRVFYWELNFWASENWSARVHFEGHSLQWRVTLKIKCPTLT